MEAPKRIRKPMTPEALAKLALARKKANEMRTQNKLTKIDDKKINKLEIKMSELREKQTIKKEEKELLMPEPPKIIQPDEYAKPEMTQREIILNQTYNNMINGNFAESFSRRR
tara:strand:- start:51 stop:389 length:339 start_codon:yes stop_codon:yes gene_type:complete